MSIDTAWNSFCVFAGGVIIILCLMLVHILLCTIFDDVYFDFLEKVFNRFNKLRKSMVRRQIYREMHYDSSFSYTVKKNGLLGFPFLWFREESFNSEDSAREYIARKKREYEKKYGKKIIKSTRVKL